MLEIKKFMDDKEKEKFGVVIDKQNQSEGESSKTSDSPSEDQNLSNDQDKLQNESQNQPEIEDSSNENKNLSIGEEKSEEQNQNLSETTSDNNNEKKEHEVIHKKEGRLHIYVRQDKYKGELKSKNWVGRLYKDGKQKIFSSGTPNLDDAIPILEKWFDDVHAEKKIEQTSTDQTNPEQITEPNISGQEPQPQEIKIETTAVETITQTKPVEKKEEVKVEKILDNSEIDDVPKSFLDKLKNIKFKKPSFGKSSIGAKNFNIDKNKLKDKFNNFVKSKIGKQSAQGEEIVGVEITNQEIRLSQISSNKANQWLLDNFYVHPINLPEDSLIVDHSTKVSEELNIALQKSKIKTPNAAIAIPVTNAIIRVVTAPLMNDEELKKAIDTNSLWENLVQLTDNLDDYSIFHQVINRNTKDNTMDILFVASKLADINNYTAIIKNSGLNPVIIDVKCFALKSAVDQINQISNKTEDANFTVLLEFGLTLFFVNVQAFVDFSLVLVSQKNGPPLKIPL